MRVCHPGMDRLGSWIKIRENQDLSARVKKANDTYEKDSVISKKI